LYSALEAAEHSPCNTSPVSNDIFVVISIVVPKGSDTSLRMCLKLPPDLVTLKSIVTSELVPLTLDTKIPITVSVVEAGTASIISAADVPRTLVYLPFISPNY